MKAIYLDHSATTPLNPLVLKAMLPFYQEHFGNPSSVHSFGRTARNGLNKARDRMAALLACEPSEIIFTSGGTESDNMALYGVIGMQSNLHIITTQVEHHAIIRTCKKLENMGVEITYLPVDSYGQVQIENVRAAIRSNTIMISMIHGNNEVGTLQPIEEVGKLAKQHNIYFHVDAVQSLGKVPIDLSKSPVDMMSFSSHKINGPKGMGALYVSRKVKLAPFMLGGAQEWKRRAGTENLAGIVGFVKAIELATQQLTDNHKTYTSLRNLMIRVWQQSLNEDQFVINGHPSDHLPHILNVSFPELDTESLLMNLDLEGVAAASGSACSSGSLEISHVLQAMNLPEKICTSAIRFSFGMGTSEEDVISAAKITAFIVNRLRK